MFARKTEGCAALPPWLLICSFRRLREEREMVRIGDSLLSSIGRCIVPGVDFACGRWALLCRVEEKFPLAAGNLASVHGTPMALLRKFAMAGEVYRRALIGSPHTVASLCENASSSNGVGSADNGTAICSLVPGTLIRSMPALKSSVGLISAMRGCCFWLSALAVP